MTKTEMGMLVAGFAALAGCASGGVVERRGTMVMAPGAVRAFAAGPGVVHAYSLDNGGRVFIARATTGSDADCTAAASRVTGGATLAVDQRNVVTLLPGEVACVATSSRRNYELMWHTRPTEAPGEMILVAQARR